MNGLFFFISTSGAVLVAASAAFTSFFFISTSGAVLIAASAAFAGFFFIGILFIGIFGAVLFRTAFSGFFFLSATCAGILAASAAFTGFLLYFGATCVRFGATSATTRGAHGADQSRAGHETRQTQAL